MCRDCGCAGSGHPDRCGPSAGAHPEIPAGGKVVNLPGEFAAVERAAVGGCEVSREGGVLDLSRLIVRASQSFRVGRRVVFCAGGSRNPQGGTALPIGMVSPMFPGYRKVAS